MKRGSPTKVVFKKYTYKKGKRYGPYLYENKRVNGKVVSVYLGHVIKETTRRFLSTEKHKNKALLTGILIGALGVLLLLFFITQLVFPTGKVSLDIKSEYKVGEELNGKLKLTLKEGELIPKDSKLVVSLGGNNLEFSISELIKSDVVIGKFYAEGITIFGGGDGYGIPGKRELYPEVDFELRIFDLVETVDGEKEKEIIDESVNETEEEVEKEKEEIDESVNEIEEEVEKEEDKEKFKGEIEEAEKEAEEEVKEAEKEEKKEDSREEDVVKEENGKEGKSSEIDSGGGVESGEGDVSSGAESGETSDSTSSTISPSSTSGEERTITGEAIAENEIIVSGKASKDNNFIYNLDEMQDVEIVSGSVKVNGSIIGDENVKLQVKDDKAEVSTDYKIIEEGFGEEFLGDKELKLEIDLSKFRLVVNESGKIDVKLVYDNTTLIDVSEEIGVYGEEEIINETILNETEILNETIGNLTEENITFSNMSFVKEIPPIRIVKNSNTSLDLNGHFIGAERYEFVGENISAFFETSVLILMPNEGFSGVSKGKIIAYAENASVRSNEFTILVSSGAMKIVTAREKIKVGKPVKWIKNISLEIPEKVIVDLPNGAENIRVKKIKDGEKESIASVIGTGQVSAEIELDRTPRISRWFRKLFSVFTGKVVEEQNVSDVNLQNAVVEVVLEDNATNYIIEYETEGPIAFEEDLSRGKRVIISGPDELEYKDVIASANLSNRVKISDANKIKVYWRNYNYTGVRQVKDVDEVEDIEIVEVEDNMGDMVSVEDVLGGEASEENGSFANNGEEVINNITIKEKTNESGDIRDEDNSSETNLTEEDGKVNETIIEENSLEEITARAIVNNKKSGFKQNSEPNQSTGFPLQYNKLYDKKYLKLSDNYSARMAGWQTRPAQTRFSVTGSVGSNLVQAAINSQKINGITRRAIINENKDNSSQNESFVGEVIVNNSDFAEGIIDKGDYVLQEIPFDAYDLDEDGYADYIEWVVPHLSNQTFEIIEITKAEHLDSNRTFIEDVYEDVKAKDDNWTLIPAGDYLRVTFERNLTSSRDITIYARASCEENKSVMVNGTEVPCDIYKKKIRIDELRRLLNE